MSFIVENNYKDFEIRYEEFVGKFIATNKDGVEIEKEKLSDLRQAIINFLKNNKNKIKIDVYAINSNYGESKYEYHNATITSYNADTKKVYFTISTKSNAKLKKQTDLRWIYPHTFIKKTAENKAKIEQINSHYAEIETIKGKIEEIAKTLESYEIEE